MKNTLILLYSMFAILATYGQKNIPIVLGTGLEGDTVVINVNGETVFKESVYSNYASGYSGEVMIPRRSSSNVSIFIEGFGYQRMAFDPKMLKRNSVIIVDFRFARDEENCFFVITTKIRNRKKFQFI